MARIILKEMSHNVSRSSTVARGFLIRRMRKTFNTTGDSPPNIKPLSAKKLKVSTIGGLIIYLRSKSHR
jgi:hypothetical protein